jgi:hypothetical protein
MTCAPVTVFLCLAGGIIAFMSKLQPTVATSGTEAGIYCGTSIEAEIAASVCFAGGCVFYSVNEEHLWTFRW